MADFESQLHSKRIVHGYGFAIISIRGEEKLRAKHGSEVTYSILGGEIEFSTPHETRVLRRGDKIRFKAGDYYKKAGCGKFIARDFPPFDLSTLEFEKD